MVKLDYNGFFGDIPYNEDGDGVDENLYNASHLTTFTVSNNQLTGTIPWFHNFDKLSGLEVLDLSNNLLVGTITSSINQMSNLRYFNVSHNQLTGSIDILSSSGVTLEEQQASLRNTTAGGRSLLEVIDVSYNQLGTNNDNDNNVLLPTYYGVAFPQLHTLKLNNNEYLGKTIPSELGYLHDTLQVFDVSNNAFTGILPSQLSTLTNLQYFNVENNMLRGTIPTDYINLLRSAADPFVEGSTAPELPSSNSASSSKLEYFNIQNNMFTGTIDFLCISNDEEGKDGGANENDDNNGTGGSYSSAIAVVPLITIIADCDPTTGGGGVVTCSCCQCEA